MGHEKRMAPSGPSGLEIEAKGGRKFWTEKRDKKCKTMAWGLGMQLQYANAIYIYKHKYIYI